MTPKEFRQAMLDIGWSFSGLAFLLGVHDREVARWCTSNERRPPPAVEAWVRTCHAWHLANPPPPKPAAAAQ